MQCTGLANCAEVWSVIRQLVVGWRFAVSAPDPLDLAGVAVEHRDAMVAVAVGGVDFIGLGVEFERRDLAELGQIGARGQRPAFAEFFHELSVGRELQHHGVGFAVAAEPDKSLVVDKNGMLLQRPVVAKIVARPAPRLDHVARLIEHQYRWRRHAALRSRRIERRALLVVGERARPLEHPDIVLRIDSHATDLSEDPVIRQRPRPIGIDAECRRLGVGRK